MMIVASVVSESSASWACVSPARSRSLRRFRGIGLPGAGIFMWEHQPTPELHGRSQDVDQGMDPRYGPCDNARFKG